MVNIKRLKKNIESLGEIGFIEGRGVNRPAHSQQYDVALGFVESLMRNAGMITYRDAVGNSFGVKSGEIGHSILMGSHIDSVPDGGIFDGCLGVLAAVEVVQTLMEQGYTNKHGFMIAIFNEEEGNVIGGLFGSKCFAGKALDSKYLKNMKKFGISLNDVKKSQFKADLIKNYIELHIEQGGKLDNRNIEIGIVEGIVGIARYKVIISGEANHSGATPMYLRNDALVKASRIINRVNELVQVINKEMVGTVGWINVSPGVFNVIPGYSELGIELRSNKMEHIDIAIEQLSKEFCCDEISFENVLYDCETILDRKVIDIIEKVCIKNGHSYQKMFSGAGHDAISLADITPSGMIFIPSVNGISHSIKEKCKWDAVQIGSDVLLETLIELDKEGTHEN